MEKVNLQSDKNIDELLASITEGKDVKPDIFEDIKNISKNGEPEIGTEASTEAEEFECPVCGSKVEASATSCDGCGAQFEEEEIATGVEEKFSCPVCSADVDASAAKCPNCGVEFEEEIPAEESPQAEPEITAKEEVSRELDEADQEAASPKTISAPSALRQRIISLKDMQVQAEDFSSVDQKTLYKELPRIVSEVKPLLLSAKKNGVGIESSKQLINDAIAFGKKKEMAKAVRLVSEAKASLQTAFLRELTSQLESIYVEAEKAKSMGSQMSPIEDILEGAVALIEDGNFDEVGQKIAMARNEFSLRAGGYYKAKEAIESAKNLVEDSSILKINLSEAKKAIVRARDALEKKRWDIAEVEADKAKGFVLEQLPKFLNKEMKQARNLLLDLKVKGGDLTKPIAFLKEASIHLKREEYADAVHFVRLFRQEIGAT